MRKNWFTATAAVGLLACSAATSTAAPGEGLGWFQGSTAPSAASPSYGPQKPSWTEKVKSTFKRKPKGQTPATPSPEEQARRQALDPISLGYNASPGSPQLYVAMAEMSYRGGNAAQARQLYQKALAMDAKHADALIGAARMEDREGQLDVALSLYQRAVAVQPQNPMVLNDLALCCARKGDLQSANRALQDTIKLDPKKSLYRNNIAKVLIEMNQVDAAAWHLAQVHPPAVVQYNMGVLLCQRGRNAEAEQFLSRAVAIDPSMQPARVLLTQISPNNPAAMAAQPQPEVRTAMNPAMAAPMVVSTPAIVAPTATAPQTTAPVMTTPTQPVMPQALPAVTPTPMATPAPTTPTMYPNAVGAVGPASELTPPLAMLPSHMPTIY